MGKTYAEVTGELQQRYLDEIRNLCLEDDDFFRGALIDRMKRYNHSLDDGVEEDGLISESLYKTLSDLGLDWWEDIQSNPRNYQIYVQACIEKDYPKEGENYNSEMYAGTDADTLWESFGKKIMEGIAKGDRSVVNTVFNDLLKRLPSDPNIAKTSFPVRAKDYIDFQVKKSRAFLCQNDENDWDGMKRYEWRRFLNAIAHYKDTFEHRITAAQKNYEKRLRYLQGKECGHIILGSDIEDKFREIYKHNLVKYGEKTVDLHTLKDCLKTFSERITYEELKKVIIDILDNQLAPNAAYNSLRDKPLYAALYAQIAPKLAKGQSQGR